MTFDVYDVIIVPFPFTDRQTSKRRPAVVPSTAGSSAPAGHVVAAIITSASQSAWSSDVPLTDLGAAGLSVECVVRMKLFTLDAGLVVRKAGRLATADAAAVAAIIR